MTHGFATSRTTSAWGRRDPVGKARRPNGELVRMRRGWRRGVQPRRKKNGIGRQGSDGEGLEGDGLIEAKPADAAVGPGPEPAKSWWKVRPSKKPRWDNPGAPGLSPFTSWDRPG